jgi:hypothetical protein
LTRCHEIWYCRHAIDTPLIDFITPHYITPLRWYAIDFIISITPLFIIDKYAAIDACCHWYIDGYAFSLWYYFIRHYFHYFRLLITIDWLFHFFYFITIFPLLLILRLITPLMPFW